MLANVRYEINDPDAVLESPTIQSPTVRRKRRGRVRSAIALAVVAVCGGAFAAVTPKFPRTESDIGFGKTLASFGIKDTRIVHAKDFGWNAKNATKALQKALDSKATTVILDKMPSPWIVDTIHVRSRQRLLLKKGVEVYRDRTSPTFHRDSMFRLDKCREVIIEGEGMEECLVAAYDTPDGVKRNCRDYGGSIFRFNQSKNVVIRNLRAGRSECDGLDFSGDLVTPSVDTWVENVDLPGHYRQAMSLVVGRGIYLKNVRFRWTNGGGPPMCGIDVETEDELSPCTDLYLFDCAFEGNNGGDIYFANYSKFPIRFYAARCHFKPGPAPAVIVHPRAEYYIPKGAKADAKIVFDDCLFERDYNMEPVRLLAAPLFDLTFRACKFLDTGKACQMANGATHVSPIVFRLDRGGDKSFKLSQTGVAEFIDCEVRGFAGPAVDFHDVLGEQPVIGGFKGTLKYNGKSVDLSQFKCEGADRGEARMAITPVTELVPKDKLGDHGPKKVKKSETADNCKVAWGGPWYQTPPAYTYYFWGEKGKTVSFTLKYWTKTRWRAELAPYLRGRHLEIETPEGKVNLGAVRCGDNPFSFTPKKNGWCLFHPPKQDGATGNYVRVEDVRGADFAYLGDTLDLSVAKFNLVDPAKGYVAYFEVPPKAECHIRINQGTFELRNPGGKVVDSCVEGKYAGRYDFRFQAAGTQREIWSLRTPPGTGTRMFRPYAPLTGIWAGDPARLPLRANFKQ